MRNSRLLSIMRKELIQITRDRRIVIISFIQPIIMLFLLGFAASSDVRNVPAALFDQDHSKAARDLIVAYQAADYFQFDHEVDSVEEMRRLLDTLEAALAAGRHVYVHCWGGVGRTGMVIGCHLVHRGLEGQQALERMAELWQEVSEDKRRRFPGSPHTWQQLDYVRNWSTRT